MSEMMRVAVIGAAIVDIFAKSKPNIVHGSSNPAFISVASGGVARNIAENLSRLGAAVDFVTAIGDDTFGDFLRERCAGCGIDSGAWIVRRGMSTAVYIAALNNDGELYSGFNSTSILESVKTDELVPYREMIGRSDLVIVDANLTEEAISEVISMAGRIPVMADTVSVAKAPRLTSFLPQLGIIKANRAEAASLTGLRIETEDDVRRVCRELLSRGVARVFITLGAGGVCAADNDKVFFIPVVPVEVRNVIGAGDAFSAGIALYSRRDLLTQARFGALCAALTLKADEPVNPTLTISAAEKLMQFLWT